MNIDEAGRKSQEAPPQDKELQGTNDRCERKN